MAVFADDGYEEVIAEGGGERLPAGPLPRNPNR
jgi:hypothetical protein